jgi:hypothetical protein
MLWIQHTNRHKPLTGVGVKATCTPSAVVFRALTAARNTTACWLGTWRCQANRCYHAMSEHNSPLAGDSAPTRPSMVPQMHYQTSVIVGLPMASPWRTVLLQQVACCVVGSSHYPDTCSMQALHVTHCEVVVQLSSCTIHCDPHFWLCSTSTRSAMFSRLHASLSFFQNL